MDLLLQEEQEFMCVWAVVFCVSTSGYLSCCDPSGGPTSHVF